MDKIIKMLREQMILCSRLNELFSQLDTALKDNTSGAGVTSTVQAIEPLMKELSGSDVKIQTFLKETNSDSLKNFIDSQPESIEHSVADRLLNQVSNLQMKLRHQIIMAASLLVKSKEFIDFNVNVISQTRASTTYGPPGAEIEHQRKIRIFDANV